MDSPTFGEVREAVSGWLGGIRERLVEKSIKVDIEGTETGGLFAYLDFGGCMAGIVVGEPVFAPYRFVSIEVGAFENGVFVMLHTWFDEAGTTVEEIITNLDKAIDVVSQYSGGVPHRDENSKQV